MTAVAELAVGASRTTVLVENLTRTRIVQYAGASGDYNPLHTDERFAREVAGYPGVFAHGMLTMGMTARAVTDWVGEERLTRFGGSKAPAAQGADAFGEVVTVSAVEGDEASLEVTTTNQDGVVVLTGTATCRLGG